MITTTLYRSCRGLFIVFLISLSACTSAPQKQPDISPEAAERSAADWLKMAQGAAPQQRPNYQLEAARLYQQDGQYEAVADILRAIDPDQLRGDAIQQYLVMAAAVVERESGSEAALAWLYAEQQQALLQRSPHTPAEVYATMADLQDRTGNHLAAADIRIQRASLLTDTQTLANNQDAIWRSLLQVDSPLLQLALDGEIEPQQRGWYELALLGQTLRGDIEQQRFELDSWQHRWPTHPAALQPPDDMELLRQLAQSKPRQIAVLLPLQGKLQQAGYAIRDGILCAHFDNAQADGTASELRFYDTESNPDMAALYQQVVADGAELIIGPLTKNRVEALLNHADGTVPVLALNYAAAANSDDANIYQFGLSSDDDARAAAVYAAELEYRRAFVIHGADSQSVRNAEAFQQAWQKLDGETAAIVEFDSERTTSERIKQGLHVDRSQQRARRLENITGTSLEYNPRRRQDIDFVYLPVGSQQARSIKPLLAFHFAESLPVYATSRVNRGKPDRRRDADLNGVYFTDTPWALDAMPRQSQRIDAYIERGGAVSKNLYALGIDAYQLAPRIPQLLYSPGLEFQGTTGTLLLSNGGVITRRPSWAVFRGGIATPLETAIPETDNEARKDAMAGQQQKEQSGRYQFSDR